MRKILLLVSSCLVLLSLNGQELYPKKEGKLWGYVNENDSIIVQPTYSAVGEFLGEYAWINIGGKCKYDQLPYGGKWGVIDFNGKVVCPVEYDYVEFCQDGVVAINKGGVMNEKDKTISGGKWGYYDLQQGVEIVPPKYDHVGPFYASGVAWVHNGGNMVQKVLTEEVKNDKGKVEYVKRNFMVFDDFVLYKIFVHYNASGKWALIDKSGKELTDFIFNGTGDFHNGYCMVAQDGMFGMVNSEGKITVPCKYEEISDCYPEKVVWAWVKSYPSEDIVLVDVRDGKQLTASSYSSTKDFESGVAWVSKNDLYGLVDATGKELIAPTYVEVGKFKHGIAFMRKDPNGLLGYVNDKGKQLTDNEFDRIPTVFGDVSPFVYRGTFVFSWVKKGDELLWIDQDGQVVSRNSKSMFNLEDVVPDELWDY